MDSVDDTRALFGYAETLKNHCVVETDAKKMMRNTHHSSLISSSSSSSVPQYRTTLCHRDSNNNNNNNNNNAFSKALQPSTSFRAATTFLFSISLSSLFYLTTLAFCIISFSLSAPISAVVNFAVASGITNTNPPLITFTLGYLRMATDVLDSPHELAGYLAAVQKMNEENAERGILYALNVTTIPCGSFYECETNRSAAHEAMIVDFINNKMKSYSAIIQPNNVLSSRLIDAAKAMGGVPIINSKSTREVDYSMANQHVIQFTAHRPRQIDHLFTFMQQDAACALTGIFYGNVDLNAADMAKNTEYVRGLFKTGNLPEPEDVNVDELTDEELANWFIRDLPLRRCFIVLMPYFHFKSTIQRLRQFSDYVARDFHFYGVSLVAVDEYRFDDGNTRAFGNIHFIQWSPPVNFPGVVTAFARWQQFGDRSQDVNFIAGLETIPTDIRPATARGYMLMTMLVRNLRSAASAATRLSNSSLPISWADIVTTFYREARAIEGFTFAALVRSCPQAPYKQICFCNTITRASFVYTVNRTTGLPVAVFDDTTKGQRDIASISYPESCGFNASSWSYPLNALALYPETTLVDAGLLDNTNRRLSETFSTYNGVWAAMTYNNNYAPTKPARPFRYFDYAIPAGSTTQEQLDLFTQTINPFVVLGSLEGDISRSSVLTIYASLNAIALEDPPLVPYSSTNQSTSWQWNILHLTPPLADYIHAAAAYYAQYTSKFSHLYVVAASQREAELASMSFATYGFDVPVSDILIPVSPLGIYDNVLMEQGLQKWFSGVGVNNQPTSSQLAYTPYVLVISRNNTFGELVDATRIAVSVGNGVLCIAAPMFESAVAFKAFTALYDPTVISPSSSFDVIYINFQPERWMPEVKQNVPESLHPYFDEPLFQRAYLAIAFSQQLSAYVQYDYTATAAETLYRIAVVSAADTSFGPFYNDSCTANQISRNERDRKCQCTKGIRTTYVLSFINWLNKEQSQRTRRFSNTLTACGIVYQAYVPPPPANVAPSSNSLSAGAVAGIVVAVVVVAFIILGLVVFALCYTGRSHRTAPKDPSQPFAIVFTDIQSSTALWARAPNAMATAIDAHHAIIRAAIARHNGYEVKTVGDSFMIAFKDPNDATLVALEIQQELHNEEWPSEINASYVELLAEAALDELVDETYEGGEDDHQLHEANESVGGDMAVGTFSVSLHRNNNNQNPTLHTSNVDIESITGTQNSERHAASSQHNHNLHLPFAATAASSANGMNASVTSTPADVHPNQQHNNTNTTINIHLLNPAAVGATNSRSGSVSGDNTEQSITDSGAAVGVTRSGINNSSSKHTQPQPRQSPRFIVEDENDEEHYRQLNNNNNTTPSQQQQQQIPLSSRKASTVESFHEIVEQKIAAAQNETCWNGIRVRIGVHYGLGDIRKDQTTHAYDYYGTVVNTAARVEGVGHGGQTLITEAAYAELDYNFARNNNVVVVQLGPQPLRGLDSPIKLIQLLPGPLRGRKFPALRLHIENGTEDVADNGSSVAFTAGGTVSSSQSTVEETPEEIAQRLVAHNKQYSRLSSSDILLQYYFFNTMVGPLPLKERGAVASKIGEAWGFDRGQVRAAFSGSATAAAAGNGGGSGVLSNSAKNRLVIGFVGKMTRTFVASKAARQLKKFNANNNRHHHGSSLLGSNANGKKAKHQQQQFLRNSYNPTIISSSADEGGGGIIGGGGGGGTTTATNGTASLHRNNLSHVASNTVEKSQKRDSRVLSSHNNKYQQQQSTASPQPPDDDRVYHIAPGTNEYVNLQ